MIYIDFYGGTHGNFLRFLINRFVAKIPEYKNFIPFNISGVSHVFPKNYNTLVQCNHYSNYELVKPKFVLYEHHVKLPKLYQNDLLIRIHVEFDKHNFIWLYNTFCRALTLYHDTDLSSVDNENEFILTKQIYFAKGHVEYCQGNIKCLRNVFYSLIREPNLFFNKIDQYSSYLGFVEPKTKNYLDISLDTFFNYNDLFNLLIKIAMNQGYSTDIDQTELFKVWQMFINNSGGYLKKTAVDTFFNQIINDVSCDSNFQLSILQESYLNYLLSKHLSIYDEISTFENEYLNLSSTNIAAEIKNILHRRNKDFNQNISIQEQQSKIVLF